MVGWSRRLSAARTIILLENCAELNCEYQTCGEVNTQEINMNSSLSITSDDSVTTWKSLNIENMIWTDQKHVTTGLCHTLSLDYGDLVIQDSDYWFWLLMKHLIKESVAHINWKLQRADVFWVFFLRIIESCLLFLFWTEIQLNNRIQKL